MANRPQRDKEVDAYIFSLHYKTLSHYDTPVLVTRFDTWYAWYCSIFQHWNIRIFIPGKDTLDLERRNIAVNLSESSIIEETGMEGGERRWKEDGDNWIKKGGKVLINQGYDELLNKEDGKISTRLSNITWAMKFSLRNTDTLVTTWLHEPKTIFCLHVSCSLQKPPALTFNVV